MAARPARRTAAPWVRTRLRTAPGAALALALLALLTSFLAAAFPRAVDAYESEGLRHELSSAIPQRSVFGLSAAPQEDADPDDRAAALRGARVAEQYREIVAGLPKPLRADAEGSAYGARVLTPVPADDPWLPHLDGGPTVFTVSSQAGLESRSELRSGRLPRAGHTGPTAGRVEAAVTVRTAAVLGIKAGSTVHLARDGTRGPLAVTVTGVVEPLRPELGYWDVEPVLRAPAKLWTSGPTPEPYWHGALLLPPEAAPVLLSLDAGSEAYWRLAVDPEGLRAGDLPALRAAVASLERGPARAALRESVAEELDAESGLDDLLGRYADTLTAIGPVVAVGAFGVGTVAAIVLLMSGGLAAARRHGELALLRSRGGSLPGTAGRLLAEVAVPVLPATAVGCALAFVLLPGAPATPSLIGAGAVALIGCAALPLRAALAHRRPRLPGERADSVRKRPSGRRTVAEATLLVLAVAAALALRRRGAAGGSVDWLVSAAPVLVGVAGALLLVRLYPLPLRLLALPMARRRGAIGFLSLARAGRAPATTALPLLALLVALTTAAFGGSVLAGVADARDRASLLAVGADARVEAAGDELPKGLADRVREVAGVREAVAVRREFDIDLLDGDQDIVTLIAVDPEAYARLSAATGHGGFDAGELRASAGALPAIASPSVAARLGEGASTVAMADGSFSVRVTRVRESTPAMGDGNFLLIDAAGLPVPRQPSTLLITGSSVSGPGLRAAVPGSAEVLLRSAERAAFTDSPVQSGAGLLYAVASATGAGYAVLAVLLSLLRAAPERTALLARLRTMGLTRRQSRWLLILENLPQTALAGAGGALVGWAAIVLLAPGVDLARLALAGQGRFDALGPVWLRADAWSLVLPALGVVAVAAGVAAAQAWLTTRRGTTTELRVGDAR
ncbi:membrane protein [Streptomyces inusitatus]|uniref:Membrane protein n=1 Tax=Streptomyces inusitatus TaxID=68221 RepID=A0A918UU28_9ACTN|nr:ABC transporter permease [Streptomyces inusitatus]GGZ35461.1 membrane protein [Streptomyces inusitatus]